MKARDFFLRARSAERDIRRLEMVMEHYMAVGTNISPQIGRSGGRTGKNTSSRVEAAVCGLYDAEIGIREELDKYRRIVAEAENVISRIPQDRFRQILSLHYLTGMSLADVSEKLAYKNPRSIYNAHGWALMAAQRILDGGIARHED